MADLFEKEQCEDLALTCSDSVLSLQHPEGYWEYPPMWPRQGRIATVEGDFAALGLLEGYRRTQRESFLVAARQWHRFLIDEIGFEKKNGFSAINYWAGVPKGMVPNNTTLTLWTLAELADTTGDDAYLRTCEKMIAFLGHVQMESGELPYSAGDLKNNFRPHFLCFQYNAFEFLDLLYYYKLTRDQKVRSILCKLAKFLSQGITRSGAARYNCSNERIKVPYYTAALAAALSHATELELDDFRHLADSAFRWVLSKQRADGGMAFFSRGNYNLLFDRRSYPRNLSMILYHLASEIKLKMSAPQTIF
jgi:hypothetical protein